MRALRHRECIDSIARRGHHGTQDGVRERGFGRTEEAGFDRPVRSGEARARVTAILEAGRVQVDKDRDDSAVDMNFEIKNVKKSLCSTTFFRDKRFFRYTSNLSH